MQIVSFITDPITVQAILTPLGEPPKPPPVTPPRGPPQWEIIDQEPDFDTAQPEPGDDFDQTMNG